ncbi:hypothetical protein BZG06_00405 [Salinivibrio kushneri]|uniref:DUF2061 domain-containing protein n=1 Tax=Salinivibrio kushneri TaxID=1908198 RepID=A0AB36K960_9GAMM|nr:MULTISPECIES: DUF2061 domain-containing protein [Salinivibrio]OOE36603.1 hypothetical protein BZG04_05990 [Salinivibrio kushneri]OOE40314.1 hypothetical protein BZG00_05655 [Salinivibrio kushneri]OOE46296.1 hypothetical protein BZG09_01085 [Salinivibrio kushneri]OOE48251.1 hypothetical protein BZG06_00405 [Salinivibrio kushneri]OOE69190.1 hypothetical protein BZG14_02060 [Salinivibrio sp. IB282]
MKKTLSFAAIHFSIAFTVAYVLTGDIIIGSLIAMTEPTVNTGAFYLHEKLWQLSRRARPAVKTASFAVVHFNVAFLVGYLISGDWLVGGALALVEPSINTLAYFFHEKVWQRRHAVKPAPPHLGHHH